MPARVRQGDLVVIISGNDRGKRGRVLRTIADTGRIVVEGVNLRYKHLRRSQQNPQGGRVRREMPVHASNVMPIDPETNTRTRTSTAVEDGKRIRVSRRSGKPIGWVPRKGAKASGGATEEQKEQ